MSDLAKRMIGETGTTTGSMAPVECGAPLLSDPAATAAKRRIPTLKKPMDKAKMRSRVVDGIIGQLKEGEELMEDSRDGYVIPDDAKEVRTLEVAVDAMPGVKPPEVPGSKVKNPYSGEEPLILPAASLVAPDVTPEALSPLDPSQLPGADRGMAPQATPPPQPVTPAAANPVINTVLGKLTPPTPPGEAPAAAVPKMSTESALSHLPGIPSPGAYVASENVAAIPTGDVLLKPKEDMPEHKPANVTRVMDAFSQFVPRQPIQG